MIDIKHDEHVIGWWFAGGTTTDWMAASWVRGDKIITRYRNRYYNQGSTNPWDEKDKKNWYEFIGDDTPEARQKIHDAMTKLWEMSRKFGFIEFGHKGDCTGEELLGWMKGQPFVHTRTATPEEVIKHTKEMKTH